MKAKYILSVVFKVTILSELLINQARDVYGRCWPVYDKHIQKKKIW